MLRLNSSTLTSRVEPRRFTAILGIVGLLALCISGLMAPAILALDPFALWYGEGPRRILTTERLNKYLLAHRYVPQYFDGVLMGPSYSANFDTRLITSRRLYNLSINGGNATELRKVFTPAAESGKLQYVVITIDPYILATEGYKDDTLRWSSAWEAALSSMAGRQAALRALDLEPVEDVFADSAAGWNNFDLHKVRDPRFTDEALAIQPGPQDISTAPILVRPAALRDLKAIVDLAHEHEIKVFAYYYPRDAASFQTGLSHGWPEFRATVDAVFGPEDIVWDMNTPDYDHIRRKGEAYTDGHLSQIGAALVLAEIQRQLDAHLPAK